MNNLIISGTLLAFMYAGLTLTPVALATQEHAHETANEHGDEQHENHADDSDHDTPAHKAEQEHDEHAHGDDDHDEDKHGHDAHNEEDTGHGEEEHGHDEEGVSLNTEQTALANIQVGPLAPRTMDYSVYAPGEIKANGYTSYFVSPRVESVVIRRHAALGEHVKKGQPLVTLFSETVAEAQAAFRISHAEWQRTQKLGRKTVGDKRYITAQTDREAAYGRLKAFGLSDSVIQSIPQSTSTLGEYTLNAEIDGAVLSDDFQQGQRVEAGEPLMILADERELWVEARMAPNKRLQLPAGTPAEIKVGNDVLPARVTQEAHTIDPETRTRVVRLLVDNTSHRLHPGMFADVFFNFKTEQPVLAVPETALMRSSDGDWTIFVEDHPGEFKPVEVELGRPLGQWREISGVEPGTRIVMEGAFFVASQIAKGGFDPHNH
ncbi:MAG: efflux RND transporter periplasmic adaptor subunit [Planctomycetia bacterium]|nr:efflux RND transporter periplasmic adaptor subunit [Planctomycetia bacterium]